MKTKTVRWYPLGVVAGMIATLVLTYGFYPQCRMKYKEHYRLTILNIDLLQRSGEKENGEVVLKPASTITNGTEFYLHFRFAAEYFNVDKKTKAYPRYGSLGPLDTISTFHVMLHIGESNVIMDSLLNYGCNGSRIWLESPRHNIPAHTLVNPLPAFSSISDFTVKYNARHEAVRFDELERNGIVLKGVVTQEISSDPEANMIALITFTDGRTLSDTLKVQWGTQ